MEKLMKPTKQYVVVNDREAFLTMDDGTDFYLLKDDIILVEGGEIYWTPKDKLNEKVLTISSTDLIEHLIELGEIQ